MGVTDEHSVRTADAQQAAYLRASLVEQRDQLAGLLAKRRDEIVRRTGEGHHSVIGRLRSQARSEEAQLRYIEGMITRLDRRFTDQPGH